MTVSTYPPALEMQANVPGMFDAQDAADQRVTVGRVRVTGIVNAVTFIPNWTQAGANTNYRTLRLMNRGQAGAGTAVVATLDLTAGVDLTAYVAKTITLGAAADRAVAVGDVLEWQSVHVAAGLTDPGGLVIVQQSAG